MRTIDEIEKVVWDRMQKAIAEKDAQKVATLNGMALEAAGIKGRLSSLDTRLSQVDTLDGANPRGTATTRQRVDASAIVVSSPTNVFGNYTGRPIRGYKLNGAFVPVRTYRDLLINLSNGLQKKHGARFEQYALQLGGRKRRYFSRNPQELKYAHELDGGGLFAETNLNANLLVNNICIPILRELEPGSAFEIE